MSGGEKAYLAALLALKRRDYRSALEQLEQAAPYFGDDREFALYRETTRLLLTVKKELARPGNQERLDVEEVFSDG